MKKKKNSFKKQLKKYIGIKGLDIIVYLNDGKIIELHKNRSIIKDEIVVYDKNKIVQRIPLAMIKSIDLFAA